MYKIKDERLTQALGYRPRVAVIIATMNRASELAQAVTALRAQTCPPDVIIASAVNEHDVATIKDVPTVSIIFGPAGSCAQRNRAIDAAMNNADLLCFFDDDYLPSRYAIEGIVRLFSDDPSIVGATGRLLADGVRSNGLSLDDAKSILAEADDEPRTNEYSVRHSPIGLYGCNMVFRVAALEGERFDEALPLYGWQEDIDFATRISTRGRLVSTDAFSGVHCGVKKGRSSGLRIGYSQVANPIYLVRKGTMPRSFALKLILKNIFANAIKSPFPEPWIDRWGRMKGNAHALRDFFLGRISPSRILGMQ